LDLRGSELNIVDCTGDEAGCVPFDVGHPHPVIYWPDTSYIYLQLHDDEGPSVVEQLWARPLDDSTYEVCSIPFSTDALSLGDFVEINADLFITKSCLESNRSVMHLDVTSENDDEILHQLNSLRDLGAIIEGPNGTEYALDAATEEIASAVQRRISELAQGAVIILR